MSDDLQPLSPREGMDRFLAHRESGVSESTYRNNQTTLEQFVAWCSDNEIDNLNDLTGRDLSQFVAYRRSKVKPITLQKNLSAIREFLAFCADIEAVRDGLNEKVHAPELPDGAEARDVVLGPDAALTALDHLDQFDYASRDHVMLLLLWRTGMRRGALRSLDLDDLRPDDNALELQHRPETDTPLKNGEKGERWVWLGPISYQVLEDYVNTNRYDKVDDHGREPLITTMQGRPHVTTITDAVNRITQPCHYGECPHAREPETCEAFGNTSVPAKCPSSRSPHAVRRGAITNHLNEGTPPEIVSERMDVSLDVLYRHYDARSSREKMAVRKEHLSE